MGDVILQEKPKNPTIIEGFPGFGLVGSIATEFLVEHLKMRRIGSIFFDDLPAMIAVHNGKIVDPIGIYYNDEHNIVVVHIITNATGFEWKISKDVLSLADTLEASSIITLEGVASATDEHKVMFYSTTDQPKLTEQGLMPLNEGIVMGVTAGLMLRAHRPLVSLFALTHAQMPDSTAAAELVKVLDKYLSLGVDYHPLLEAAKVFEQKIKSIMSQSSEAMSEKEKRAMSYVG